MLSVPTISSPQSAPRRLRYSVALAAVSALIAVVPVLHVLPAHAQVAGSLVISEIFYNPDGADERAEFVELHNPTNTSVDVSGWIIDGVDKQLAPGATVAAGDYFVIANDALGFVAMFGFSSDAEFAGQLSNGGETITVLDASGAAIDVVAYDDVAPWPSRADGDGFSLQLFDSASDNSLPSLWGEGRPTPGSATVATAGRPAAPDALVGRGLYTSSVSEELSSATPGAAIYYTLDGSVPTTLSNRSTGPITISSARGTAVTLRAIAIANGQQSLETAHTYLFLPELAAQGYGLSDAGYDQLPTVSVRTDNGLTPECVRAQPTICARQRASIDYIDPGTGEGFGVSAGIAVFGDSSVEFPKTNFRLYFDDEWGVSNLKYPVFDGYGQGFLEPTDKFDKLELRAQSWDGPYDGISGPDYYVSDRWWKDTVLDLGSLTPHGRYVNVFVNGQYHGLYDLRERFDAQWFESYGEGDASDYDSVKWDYTQVISVDAGSDALFDRMQAATSYSQAKGWIDPVALVHQSLVNSLGLHDAENEYRFIGGRTIDHPDDAILMHNDNDMLFGSGNQGFVWDPRGPSSHHLGWLDRWKADPELREIVYQETAKAFCGEGALTVQSSLDRLDKWSNEVRLAMRAEERRWTPTTFESANTRARQAITSGIPELHNAWAAEGMFIGCELSPQLVGPTDVVVIGGRNAEALLAFEDPDGDSYTLVATGLPSGLSLANNGQISGTATVAPGAYPIQVRAQDSQGRSSNHDITITVVDGGAALTSAAVVLNEYNAVDADDGLWVGTDAAFPSDPTNGGDWFELVTVADNVDLRGWSVELWDRDRDSEQLKLTDTYVFSENSLWSDVRAGSLITIAESAAQDPGYNPAAGDWSVTVIPAGGLVIGSTGFDTNRRGFRVAIRDRAGNVVGPMMGETEIWRYGGVAQRNIGAAEVGVRCATPDSTADGSQLQGRVDQSTFAAENVCDGQPQNLAPLRPVLGPPGDVDGSGVTDRSDVRTILNELVGNSPAPFNQGAADMSNDGQIGLLDALLLAREVG